MTLGARDKRALAILGIAGAAVLVFRLVTGNATPSAVAVSGSADFLERRLDRIRQTAALLPRQAAALKEAESAIAVREKGLIVAETAAQAQAQLLRVVQRLARAQAPPLELRSVELAPPKALSDDYGEVAVAVAFECGIHQLVNLLADLTAQPELLATNEIHLTAARGKEKMLGARIVVGGVVPRRLVPDKKTAGVAF